MECALDAAFWFGFEAAVAAKPGSTVISPTLKGLLESGHFEEQFPWVDPHPVAVRRTTLSPRARERCTR
ncbi:MAG: hypothetical protein DMG05_20120 [Acidobacteria bacterium]|nr:MAG: hypothetical protein DMG05_20120 [Acidobacteriota bacterium]